MTCGYCGRELLAVAHLLPGAPPCCGSAACLLRAQVAGTGYSPNEQPTAGGNFQPNPRQAR